MKKILLLISLTLLLIACGGVKKTQEALNTGNYDTVISNAIDQLKKNKTRKRKQQYVYLLESAYAKALERDLAEIKFLKKDGNPEQLENIYELYVQLDNRQNRIKPLLPLPILEEGRNARFTMKDYSNEIISAKDQLTAHLYGKAAALMRQGADNKYVYRDVFDDLRYIDEISPNYKNVRQLMEEAQAKGVDFVLVTLNNNTDKIIPRRLEDDLLNFNTYGLNDIWTIYHGNEVEKVKYDFGLILEFRDIQISPEQIRERQVIKEKEVKDGWEYALDDNGNVLKDSLGNDIKVDKFKTIRCELYEFTQFKATKVNGQVRFVNYQNQQVIEAFPITTEFVFEHQYADFDGDRRALGDEFNSLLNVRAVPFPSNEQMIYDSGEDIKARLKAILTRNRFRR
jgi:phosphoglycolate phosphatase-like HAD superfamily hydrolase